MPWPVDRPTTIAARMASVLEIALRSLYPLIDPALISRAVRTVRGVFAQVLRVFSLELREVQDHLRWWSLEWFPDTATEQTLRHASIWGVEQRPPTLAVGSVIIEGVAGTPIPNDLELVDETGLIFDTTEAGEIGEDGTLTLPIIATLAGPLSNLPAGSDLRPLVPFAGILNSRVGESGTAGGALEETEAELQRAVIRRIRQREHGGAAFDYREWLEREFAVFAVSVEPEWIGRGSVGVIVAMQDEEGLGRSPTVEELDDMQRYIGRFAVAEGVRPVTARVVLVSAEPEEVSIRVRLRPDTDEARAAVEEAWPRFLAMVADDDTDPINTSQIAATLEHSRISEAISSASGEYAHDLLEPAPHPAAPLKLDVKKFARPGPVTFEAAE